jgi:hypothetical protein
MVSFLQVYPPKPCIRLSFPPYALHAPSISLFSILSPEQYWVRSINHYASHYVWLWHYAYNLRESWVHRLHVNCFQRKAYRNKLLTLSHALKKETETIQDAVVWRNWDGFWRKEISIQYDQRVYLAQWETLAFL